MKKIFQEIEQKFLSEVGESAHVYRSNDFDFYSAISGYYNNLYFDVYFIYSKGEFHTRSEILIACTTRNKGEIIKLLGDVDKRIKIKI